MPTTVESMCCRAYKPDTKRDIVINEMLQQENICCICQHSGFSEILSTYNLDNWIEYYKQYNPEYFAAMDQNEQLRNVAYRRWIHWQFGTLKPFERIPLPACVVTCIRETFPSWDGEYKGYHYKFVKPVPARPKRLSIGPGKKGPRVKILQLMQTCDRSNDSRVIKVKVVALQDPVGKDVDQLVQKNKLWLVLADRTNAILAFLTGKKPVWFEKDTCARIWNFSYSYNTITMHDGTTVELTRHMSIPAAISDLAMTKFFSPRL